jgi:hypothetical protein
VGAFAIINDDVEMTYIYDRSKSILEKIASKYSTNTDKSKSSLFKNRRFDKGYLQPEINIELAQD